jgi:hypothetical protein
MVGWVMYVLVYVWAWAPGCVYRHMYSRVGGLAYTHMRIHGDETLG